MRESCWWFFNDMLVKFEHKLMMLGIFKTTSKGNSMFGIGTKIKTCFRILRERKFLDRAYHILARQQNLSHTMDSKIPTAADGSPVPWYTFPAIEYFQALDARDLDIFEYGSGNSSLFWARKGANVWCVEHDPDWYEVMCKKNSGLQDLMLRQDKESYAKAIHDTGISRFDMIIIDGRWRNESAVEALKCLKPDGLFILDNSDWYTDVSKTLRSNGFFSD